MKTKIHKMYVLESEILKSMKYPPAIVHWNQIDASLEFLEFRIETSAGARALRQRKHSRHVNWLIDVWDVLKEALSSKTRLNMDPNVLKPGRN
jgi:hypothetical protein